MIMLNYQYTTILGISQIKENVILFTYQQAIKADNFKELEQQEQKIDICDAISSIQTSTNEKYIYISCLNQGLYILDVESMIINKIYEQVKSQYVLIVNQTFLYVYTTTGLAIFDINQSNDTLSDQPIVYEHSLYLNVQQFSISHDLNIMFLAQNTQGYSALNISDPQNPTLITSDPFTGTYGVVNIINHPTENIVFIQTMWDKITAINFDSYYLANGVIDFYETGVYIDEFFSLKTDLKISEDGDFLFLTQVGLGVVVLDVRDLSNMFIYQILSVNGSLSSLFISPISHDNLYITVSKQIFLFQRTYPKQIEFNLFTRAQSYYWKDPGNETWPWQVLYTHNYERFYLAGGVDGLRIFDTSNLPEIVLLNSITDQQFPNFTSIFTIIPKRDNEDIIIIGTFQEHAFFIVDCTDVYNPILLGKMIIPGNNIIDVKTFERDTNKILANTYLDVFIIDITEMSNPQVISTLNDELYIIKEGSGESFMSQSPDERYMFGCSTTLDLIYIAEVSQDFQNITVKNSIYVEYPFTVMASVVYPDIVYAQGNTGSFVITRIDYETLEFSYVGQLSLQGTMFQITTNYDESLMFLTSTIKHELLTIDISNLENPTLIHIFQAPGEDAYFSSIVQTVKGTFLTINTFGGLRVIPTFVESKLNVEYYKISKGVQLLNTKTEDQKFITFKVGEECKILVSGIINPTYKNIAGFYYYDVQQPDLLQSYNQLLEFDLSKKTISFTASKELMGFNTVVVEIQVSVKESDFLKILQDNQVQPVITEGITYSVEEQAAYLYAMSQKYGYISQEGFPTTEINLDKTMIMVIGINYSHQLDLIHKFLTQKKDLYPLNFRIEKSLYFYPQINTDKTHSDIIESFTDTVEISISIEEIDGAFFEQVFQGLIVSYSGSFNQVTLSGKLQQVNQSLVEVKLHLYNSDTKKIPLHVKIIDSLNENLEEDYFFSDLEFLKTNQPVQLNNNLQEQFNAQFKEGKLFVQEQFQFQFGENTFQDDDKLIYSIFIIVAGQEVEITQQYNYENCWFNFDISQRTLKGECLLNMINTAGDGFTEQYDELQLNFAKLPALVIIYYTVLGLSGMLTVIGLFKYRGKFYRVVCKKKYQSGQYFIAKDKQFLIQIILDLDDYRLVTSQYKCLKKQLKKQNYDVTDLVDKETMTINKNQIKNILQQHFKDFDQLGYETESSYQYVTMQGQIYHQIIKMKEYSNEKQIIKDLKQISVNQYDIHREQWYQHYIDVEPIIVQDNYNYTPRIVFRLDKIFESLDIILKKKKYSEIKIKQGEVKRNSLKQISNLEVSQTDENFSKIIASKQEKYKGVNLYLILQLLKMTAIGVIKDQRFKYQYGQSITTIKQKIHIIKAQKRRGSKYDKYLKIFNFDYMNIPFSQNAPLPSWCNYKFQNNILEIYGCYPSMLSLQEQKYGFLIRIDDDAGKTLKQFELIQVDLPDPKDGENDQQLPLPISSRRIQQVSYDQESYLKQQNQSNIINQSHSGFLSAQRKQEGQFFQNSDDRILENQQFNDKLSSVYKVQSAKKIFNTKKESQKSLNTDFSKNAFKNEVLEIMDMHSPINTNERYIQNNIDFSVNKNQSKKKLSNIFLENPVEDEFSNQQEKENKTFRQKYSSEVQTMRYSKQKKENQTEYY